MRQPSWRRIRSALSLTAFRSGNFPEAGLFGFQNQCWRPPCHLQRHPVPTFRRPFAKRKWKRPSNCLIPVASCRSLICTTKIRREKPRVNRAKRDRLAFTSCGEAPSQSAFSRETDKNTSERPGQKLKPVLRQTEIARTPCFRHKAGGGGGATRDFKKNVCTRIIFPPDALRRVQTLDP